MESLRQWVQAPVPKPQRIGSALGYLPRPLPECRVRDGDGCTRRHVAKRRNANKETREGGGSESWRPHPGGKSGLGPLPGQGRPASRLGSGFPAARGWNWAVFPWGNPAAWLPTFALPVAHTGACGEIEAGGEGLLSRWREGQVDGFILPGLGFVAEFQKTGWAWGPCPAPQVLPYAGLGEGRAHLLPGPLSTVAQMAGPSSLSLLLPSGQTVTWDGDFLGAR